MQDPLPSYDKLRAAASTLVAKFVRVARCSPRRHRRRVQRGSTPEVPGDGATEVPAIFVRTMRSSCPPAPPPFNRSSALHLIQTSEPALPETLLPNLTPLRQQLRSLSPTQRQERGRQLSEALQSLDSKPQPSVAHVDPPPSGSSPVFLATVLLAAICLLYTSPSPRDRQKSRMPSSA